MRLRRGAVPWWCSGQPSAFTAEGLASLPGQGSKGPISCVAEPNKLSNIHGVRTTLLARSEPSGPRLSPLLSLASLRRGRWHQPPRCPPAASISHAVSSRSRADLHNQQAFAEMPCVTSALLSLGGVSWALSPCETLSWCPPSED